MHNTPLELKIVRDRFPRFSEVLNDCTTGLCVPTFRDEPLSSVLRKICAKITEISSTTNVVAGDGCCYTFEDTDTVTFTVLDSVVSAEATSTGTVTSVSLSDITSFALASGNPLTGSGTLGYSLISQAANKMFAGPVSGGSAVPTFRSLVAADIPISANNGLSYSAGVAKLGQLVNESGNPAAFTGGFGVDREIPMGDSYLHFNNKTGTYASNPSSITIKPINDPEIWLQGKHGGSISVYITDPSVDTFPAIYWNTGTPSSPILQVFNGLHWTAADKHYDVADMHGSILGAAFQYNGSVPLAFIAVDGRSNFGMGGVRKTSFGYFSLSAANMYAFVHIAPSTTAISHLFLDAGVAPTGGGLQNGQIWHQTDNHLYARLGGVTYQIDQQTAATGVTIGTSPITSGTDTRVLFQDGSVIGEDAGLTWDKTSNILKVINGANTITTLIDPIVFVDAGTNSYAAEFKGSGSFTGFLVSNTGGSNVPFIQMLNIGNTKYWTLTLDTDSGFNLREGTAGGTSRLKFAVGGDATFSSKVNADSLRVRTASTVTTATDAGITGDIRWDANFIYVCISTNVWKRTAISTW